MTKLLLAAVLGLACTPLAAAPVLSCDDIDEMGEALTGLGIALDDYGVEVGVNSDVEADLAHITLGLAHIADAEQDGDLARASIRMAQAWDNMDQDAFTDALADAVAKLAVISATECDG